jgi:precorrin-2/cobalt-factor-2 C20-methyltransferase
MKRKFFGVGTGPGDPELITVKAVKVLKSADVVIVPESSGGRVSIALEIASEYIKSDAEIVPLLFPMTRDYGEISQIHAENGDVIRSILDSGKTVVFLTLGDPMLYSTYLYMLEYLDGSGIEIETVPGITSFCASAAVSGIPLAVQSEELRIVPLDKSTDIKRHISDGENIVFMKVSSDNARLADELAAAGEMMESVIVSKCGRGGESVSRDISTLYGEVPYMSTVIVKRMRD